MFKSSFHLYIIFPAFNIKATANIIPKNAIWANDFPATLIILLFETINQSTKKTTASIETTIKDVFFVVTKGETNTLFSEDDNTKSSCTFSFSTTISLESCSRLTGCSTTSLFSFLTSTTVLFWLV